MSQRRRTLLLILPIVVLLPFIVGLFGMIGPIEMLIWLVLLAAWALLFARAKEHHTT